MEGDARGVHGLFEEQAVRAPDAPALVCGDVRLTYGELDARANRLARHLAALGLGPGRFAAVALGRGTELITALLAVLKTGAAYVPVEPTGPDRTIRHVLADAAPSVVVTEEVHRVRLADAGEAVLLCLDTAAAAIAARPDGPLGAGLAPDAPACVFYTSGSTGLPKGALVEHRNLLHSHRGWREVYGLTAADRFLQTATLEFDVFTADWVRALCTGGTLVMARRNFTLDRTAELSELHRLVVDERITVMETNVHTARRLLDHLQPRGLELGALRLLTVGAEKWYLDEQLRMQRYLGPAVRVVNVYGVAEAAVDSTYFDAAVLADDPEDAGQVSLIGVPFPGNGVHLIGQDGKPVPEGDIGEIWLTGPGVGRGYPRLPELTAERFRPLPHGDGRAYRTGDLARRRADGLLEYVGRDSGSGTAAAAEVEAVLRGHPEVRECAVAAAGAEQPGGGRPLVAYLVAEEGAGPEASVVRTYLADRLPEQLVPEAVVPLAALPRTRAGKLDRAALPLPAPRGHADTRAGAGAGGSGKAARSVSGKGGGGGTGGVSGPGRAVAALAVLLLSWGLSSALTDAFWPGSTDLTQVPYGWHGLFGLLYRIECLGFALGMVFLFFGRRSMARLGRGPVLTTLAHLSVCWLLAAWWPQDNMYRLTSPTDWDREARMVYGFNVTLILAAALVMVFLLWRPRLGEEPPAVTGAARRGGGR
ncbi:amino acid adenylation domain-containing protein [Streptomyces sp. TLI_235]|nr:amino acid adenylation domain-containing protein [Streptomyces sp. TLI_235]PBC75691.1 amino acid adenylation domain-containing protein [Streptomyces sp. TLI_235]